MNRISKPNPKHAAYRRSIVAKGFEPVTDSMVFRDDGVPHVWAKDGEVRDGLTHFGPYAKRNHDALYELAVPGHWVDANAKFVRYDSDPLTVDRRIERWVMNPVLGLVKTVDTALEGNELTKVEAAAYLAGKQRK